MIERSTRLDATAPITGAIRGKYTLRSSAPSLITDSDPKLMALLTNCQGPRAEIAKAA